MVQTTQGELGSMRVNQGIEHSKLKDNICKQHKIRPIQHKSVHTSYQFKTLGTYRFGRQTLACLQTLRIRSTGLRDCIKKNFRVKSDCLEVISPPSKKKKAQKQEVSSGCTMKTFPLTELRRNASSKCWASVIPEFGSVCCQLL